MKIIKLYSPFRSGSNLVKACIEHNYEELSVLNTGEKHWKHAFFAESKKYQGYIFCVRHPLDLACAIRRYYFQNGRNITMNTDWDSFFDKPIAIFDQTSKTVSSPIYYPNIYHLINAWYYNYSKILSIKKFRSTLILYENLIANQELEIKKSLKKISLLPQGNHIFEEILEKTGNKGDERYVKPEKSNQRFSKKISNLRSSCGFSSQEIKTQLSEQQLDLAIKSIQWDIMKNIGYKKKGILSQLR